jgi:hypothetical protein
MGGEVAEIVTVAPEPRQGIRSFFIHGVAAYVAATVTMLASKCRRAYASRRAPRN